MPENFPQTRPLKLIFVVSNSESNLEFYLTKSICSLNKKLSVYQVFTKTLNSLLSKNNISYWNGQFSYFSICSSSKLSVTIGKVSVFLEQNCSLRAKEELLKTLNVSLSFSYWGNISRWEKKAAQRKKKEENQSSTKKK